MLRAIKAYALENNIECYISLEEKWHAESVHVLHVYANQKILMTIQKSIIRGFAKKVLYLMLRRWRYNASRISKYVSKYS